MNKTAYILAGLLILVVGGAAMFYFLKKKELAAAKKLYDSGAVDAGAKVVSGIQELYGMFKGKKAM